ncbi:hypothetical protein AAVH_00258 [Aphelenchoides avenae]|nr:hypothetical protein AAVH_00258 [Aphelenchus avenae]
MNATLKLRFTDPAKLWQLQMRKLAKVTFLQSQQATFLRKVVSKQRATLVKADTCCKTLRAQNAELQKDAKTNEINAQYYQNQLERTKQENEALKQHIAQLEAECRAGRGASTLPRRSTFVDSADDSASDTPSRLFGFEGSGVGNDHEMASVDHVYAPFGASSSASHNTSTRTIAPERRRTPTAFFPTPSSSVHSRDNSYTSAMRTPTSLAALKPEMMASYSSKRPASSIGGRSGGGSSGYIPKNGRLTLNI